MLSWERSCRRLTFLQTKARGQLLSGLRGPANFTMQRTPVSDAMAVSGATGLDRS